MSNPLVTLLVLNWNGEDILEQCLSSLKESTYTPLEIIVVDNASTDASLEVLAQFDGVKVIRNESNLGYAAGNNVGFAAATGKYVATLNNDIRVEAGWLEPIVDLLESRSDVGIVSCRQLCADAPETIDALYSFAERHLLLGRYGHGNVYDQSNPLHAEPGYVIGANGASAVYRKSLLDQLHGFEESFFAYQEECDLHMRAFYVGWKCAYTPSAVVYHMGSHTFSRRKRVFYYHHERNRIWFIYRNFPSYVIRDQLPFVFAREVRTMLNITLRQRYPLAYLRARLDGFRGIAAFKDHRANNIRADMLQQLSRFLKTPKFPLDRTR